jgi:P-type E1-E2 ATPase
MIDLSLPGRGALRLTHLVTDVNGTLAVDGILIEGLTKRLTFLRDRLEIHLLTDDTYGRQTAIDEVLKLRATRVQPGNESITKADFVREIGAETVVAIGQGANDAEMLKVAALGICVMSREAVAVETLASADLVVSDIFSALDLLEKPMRIIASLRK